MRTDNILRVPEKDFTSFVGRSRHLYHIQSEGGAIITFKQNPAQQKLHDFIEEELARNVKEWGVPQCKIINCKGRQEGMSTYISMRNSDHMFRKEGYRLLVTAHREDETNLLYDKYTVCYDHLPDRIIIVDEHGNDIVADEKTGAKILEIKPKTDNYSGKKISYSDYPHSQMWAMTAGKGDAIAKGGTLNGWHASEFANYEHARKVINTLENQMPDNEFVFAVIESTANGTTGEGKEFYERYTRAETNWNKYLRGEIPKFKGYRPLFIEWYLMEKYKLPLFNGKRTEDYSDPHKVDILDRRIFHNLDNVDWTSQQRDEFLERCEIYLQNGTLSLEQVNWFFYCITSKHEGDYNDAMRYYPWVAEDAFRASSKTYFNKSELHKVELDLQTKGDANHLVGDVVDDGDDILFEPKARGGLRLFDFPEPGYRYRYVIGADPSAGIEGGDAAVFAVLDRLKNKWAAIWKGHEEEDVLAHILYTLGLYYNDALLVPETNLRTMINMLKPTGVIPYTGEIYIRNVESRAIQDYGFYTDVNSRPQLLKRYKAWLRKNGYNSIVTADSLEEHKKFERREGGMTPSGNQRREIFAAADGYSDDIVLAKSLAVEGDHWWLEDGCAVELLPEAEVETHRVNMRSVAARHKFAGVRQSGMGRNGSGNGVSPTHTNGARHVNISRKQSNLGRKRFAG